MMSAFRNCSLLVLALAAGACQKSAQEERTEAVNAQREADQTAREAAGDRSKEVAENDREAAEKMADTRREAQKDDLKAVQNEIERTSGAQEKANEETQEAVAASQRDAVDVRKSVESRLKKLDDRVRDLTKEANESKKAPAVQTDARQKLSLASTEISGLRSDMPTAQSGKTPTLEQFRARADQRIKEIEHTLDQVDDQL